MYNKVTQLQGLIAANVILQVPMPV